MCCILSYFSKNYQTSKIIGKGNFAKVIVAKRYSDMQEFAVKVFDKKGLLGSKNANRSKVQKKENNKILQKDGLVNEIAIMRYLSSHPNILKLYEVYEGDYHIYLVLELLKGGELFDRIIQIGHYSEQDAFKVME